MSPPSNKLLFVSTHSRPKVAGSYLSSKPKPTAFQHTAARRRLANLQILHLRIKKFQHTAARRRLGAVDIFQPARRTVSTHSRPKAAGPDGKIERRNWQCFNTQPPEGGWLRAAAPCPRVPVSTHSRPKAAGRHPDAPRPARRVSTHSRPKAAGFCCPPAPALGGRFNTQPPEGGWLEGEITWNSVYPVSTHSRPKAAGTHNVRQRFDFICFNTQPPEGGWLNIKHKLPIHLMFQHTAARRRLGLCGMCSAAKTAFQHTAARRRLAEKEAAAAKAELVSTHSRPKAAGAHAGSLQQARQVSTHSRPKAAGRPADLCGV